MSVSPSLAVRNYLLGPRFKGWLIREYSAYRILSEADLQNHVVRAALDVLRRRNATAFLVHANRYMKDCENHPDVSVSKNGRPRLWIELKDTLWFDNKFAEQDWKRLQAAGRKYRATFKAGILIYVARRGKVEKFQIVRTRKTMKLWTVVISLKDELKKNGVADFEKWNKKYRQLARCAAKP